MLCQKVSDQHRDLCICDPVLALDFKTPSMWQMIKIHSTRHTQVRLGSGVLWPEGVRLAPTPMWIPGPSGRLLTGFPESVAPQLL